MQFSILVLQFLSIISHIHDILAKDDHVDIYTHIYSKLGVRGIMFGVHALVRVSDTLNIVPPIGRFRTDDHTGIDKDIQHPRWQISGGYIPLKGILL